MRRESTGALEAGRRASEPFSFGFAEVAVVRKRTHEIRDPIHTFIRIDSDEREALDSPPLQRLRHIHQLAMSHLVYPGATHKRFEHSLGVMELAGRVFDVITDLENVHRDSVGEIIPSRDQRGYWRRVLRMAALFHDVGHLPFSHAAEQELLPKEWNHERLTVEIIRSPAMLSLWGPMTPPLRWYDVARLAVGPKQWARYDKPSDVPDGAKVFTAWEEILAEIIVGDAFGVDRMDYLLRDAHHAGVAYGRFDHYRLVDTLRILPKEYEREGSQGEGSAEPALGVEEGGLHSAEALLLARYFMYTQVYFHPVRRVYDVHLKDFLSAWLKEHGTDGRFPTTVEGHLAITDNEVMGAILKATGNDGAPGHESARRILDRDHFRLLYKRYPDDIKDNPEAVDKVYRAALREFGPEAIRRDRRLPTSERPDFPVLTKDRRVSSSVAMSEVLQRLPAATFDYVFIDNRKKDEGEKWLKANRDEIIRPKEKEEDHGPTAT
jgi:hypothetical protein